MTTDTPLLRLHGWLSPSFPIGAYTYSHALEHVIEVGELKTVSDLVARITSVLNYGSGWTDGLLCRLALDGTDDPHDLLHTAWCLRGSHELGFEATQQGEAFVRAVQAVWPMEALASLKDIAAQQHIEICYPVAFGVAARAIGADPKQALSLYLMAFVHNLISAALRAVPLGQTDGQRAVAALEPVVLEVTDLLMEADRSQLGTATIAHDIASMNHETQFTRIFRS